MLLSVALKTSRRWTTSIGLGRTDGYTNISDEHWTTDLSYVCQYHSKSLTKYYTKPLNFRTFTS